MGREPRELHGRTASGLMLQSLLGYARMQGIDVDALLRQARIDASRLDDPDYRVPESARLMLWRRLPPLSKDPFFGLHVPQHASIGALDVVDYALCYSETVGDALARFVRFSRILADALEMDVTRRGKLVWFERTAYATRHTSRMPSSP